MHVQPQIHHPFELRREHLSDNESSMQSPWVDRLGRPSHELRHKVHRDGHIICDNLIMGLLVYIYIVLTTLTQVCRIPHEPGG